MADSFGTAESGPAGKRALRSGLRERRRSLDADARLRFDAAINRVVVELAQEVGAGTIAGFRAFDGEPDLTAALAQLASLGRRLVLPVLVESPTGTSLEFRAWNPASALATNRFGIAEPRAGNQIPLEAIDLMLVPLVGWDEHGARLGMGAGYYDRALAGAASRTRPIRAGVAYASQRVERVPTEPHDVRLHLVITENGRFTCPA